MEKFDLIIANPPYANGNAIVKNLVDSEIANDYTILMPFTKYKAGNLFKHVTSLSLADPKSFKDAVIGGDLCVCRLTNEEVERELFDLEIETFNQDYREFYALNTKLPKNYHFSRRFQTENNDEKAYQEAKNYLLQTWKDHNRKFYVGQRICLTGAADPEGESVGVLWNLKKTWDPDKHHLPISSLKTNLTVVTGFFIEFKTEKECANFTRFFYANGKDGLMNKLITGLNKLGGWPFEAIPNIDWSVDRDYEHLTYEELLEIVKKTYAKLNEAVSPTMEESSETKPRDTAKSRRPEGSASHRGSCPDRKMPLQLI